MRIPLRVMLFFLNLLLLSAQAQNAPVSVAGSFASGENSITVPVHVTGFNVIGGFQLSLSYDSAIAQVSAVNINTSLGGSLAYNISSPGQIILSWFKTTISGVSLPENTELFTITLIRSSFGSSGLIWNTSECQWYDADFNVLNQTPQSSFYIDGIFSFPGTEAPVMSAGILSACNGTELIVPITVNDFLNIGTFFLTLNYDPLVLEFGSFENTSGFPGLGIDTSIPGIINIGATSSSIHGVSLPAASTLLELTFNYNTDSTGLSWDHNGNASYFTGPAPLYTPLNDIPENAFYFDGAIEEIPSPAPAGNITGPPFGVVRQGQTGVVFSTAPIENATSCFWSLPEGANITDGEGTNEIIVSFTNEALSGEVIVFGLNECGSGPASTPFTLIVKPALTAHGQNKLFMPVHSSGTGSFFLTEPEINDGRSSPAFFSSELNENSDFLYPKHNPLNPETEDFHALAQGEQKITIFALAKPYTQQTAIRYFLPARGNVEITIFGVRGEKLEAKALPSQHAGWHETYISLAKAGAYLALIVLNSDIGSSYNSTLFINSP